MAERFLQTHDIVEAWPAVDLQTGANTGDWVSLKHAEGCLIFFTSGVGTAADDPTVTVNQATSNAGAGTKALNFTVIMRKQAATNLSSTGTFTRTTQAAGNTYTNATSAEQSCMWCIDIEDSELDAANGFDHVQLTVADVGGNAQPGYACYILYGCRYQQATIPSNL